MAKKEKLVMDLDAICAFVFAEEPRSVDTVIEETVEEVEDIQNKLKKTVESKSSNHSDHEVIRFEIVRRLLDSQAEIALNEDGLPEFNTVNDVACYNTCFQYGFYKSVPA